MLALIKIFAYIRKEFLIQRSYKFAFFFNFFSVFTSLLTFFFINRLFGSRISSHLEPFGRDYFSYTILAQAFFTYVGTGLGGIAGRLRGEAMTGTLESLLVTPTKMRTLLLSMGLWNFGFASVDLFLYLFFGVFFFKIDISQINLLATFIIFFFTIIAFSSLGLISGSFILVLKRGNPVNWLVSTLSGLLGGVYFPVTVLPKWLQAISAWIPVTYAIKGLELAVYQGASLATLSSDVIKLALFAIILLPLGIYSFGYALRRAKIEGSLVRY
ncbi:MAG: ABC transporter permease [Candidatus Omnitrophica bacterium]|nr:ABC transporter permease [Candidatus Omnitrophota bacterium]